MNFKRWILNEEIWPNDTATVYHRTRAVNIESFLKEPYQPAQGCTYGCGLYTTFAIQSQFKSYMKTYGTTLCKFKVTKLDRFIICHLSLAKHILGDNYRISTQLEKLGLSNLYNQKVIEEFDQMMSSSSKSSNLARKMYEKNKSLDKKAVGIIYEGANDGYCLVKYKPIEDGTVTLLGYAENVSVDDHQRMIELQNNCKRNEQGQCTNPWITTTKKAAIKTLTHTTPEKRKMLGDKISPLEPYMQKILDYPEDKRAKGARLLMRKSKLSPKQKLFLLRNLPDVREALQILFKNDELTSPLIAEILMNSPQTNTAINAMGIDNLEKMTGHDLAMAAYNYKDDKDVVVGNILRKIIKKKSTITTEFLQGIKDLNASREYPYIDGEEMRDLLSAKENLTPDALGFFLAKLWPNTHVWISLDKKFNKKLFENVPKEYVIELLQKGAFPETLEYYFAKQLKEFDLEDVKKVLLHSYQKHHKNSYKGAIKYFQKFLHEFTPEEINQIGRLSRILNIEDFD